MMTMAIIQEQVSLTVSEGNYKLRTTCEPGMLCDRYCAVLGQEPNRVEWPVG